MSDTGDSRLSSQATAAPTGIVTFLFTDIEGSTRLLLRLGETYPDVLADHHQLMRAAIAEAGGHEAGTAGDAFFAAFADPSSAVRAAVLAQRSLRRHDWPEGGTMNVRMGLHIGPVEMGPTGYSGITVHAAARIADAAHGGQILASAALVEAAGDIGRDGATVRSLGEYRLKDLPSPELLFQIGAPDLPAEFPPVRAIDAHPHNLPGQLSAFVGRRREVAEVSALLDSHRLVTLLGPGGSGKTRLAIRVARDRVGHHPGGVYFIPLEGVGDAQGLAPAVLSALGRRAGGERPAIDLLEEALEVAPALLVLDNLEQIDDVGLVIRRLLERVPAVTVLATSRSLLRIDGEAVFEVLPLEVPAEAEQMSLDDLEQVEGVALFVTRGRAVDPRFRLTEATRGAVVQIVERLDGLPLALELAAARLREFTLEELEARLEQGIDTLSSRRADLPPRQQTLHDAIAWSYELLDEPGRTIFRQLAVFAGDFTLQAAEAVAIANGRPTDRVLFDLLDQSLLRRRVLEGETRFSLLQTLREFARAVGSGDGAIDRHLSHFASVAEAAESGLSGEAAGFWMERLDADRDNLLAAVGHAMEDGDADAGVRLVGSAWRYFHGSGLMADARRWLEALLVRSEVSELARARGLEALAGLAYWAADFDQALSRYREALGLLRALGERAAEAEILYGMSLAQSLAGDPDEGASLAVEAKSIAAGLEDSELEGRVLMAEATAYWLGGDLAEAHRIWQSAVAASERSGGTGHTATLLVGLGALAFLRGDTDEALRQCGRALDLAIDSANAHLQVFALDAIASIAAGVEPERSVTLAGAASSLRALQGGGWTVDRVGIAPARDAAMKGGDDVSLDRAWESGSSLDLEGAIALARELLVVESSGHPVPSDG